MKNTILLFIICIFAYNSLLAQVALQQKGSYECSKAKMSKQLPLKKNSFSLNSPKHSFDVTDYKMNIDLLSCFTNPYPNSFTADVIVTFKIDTALNSIKLNATNSSLIIDSVKLNGVSFVHEFNHLVIELDRAYIPGEEAKVHIFYRHKDVQDYAFYASGGFVFTDCEPEGARKWFPCWDDPSDKATTDITIKTPLNTKLGSNGRLQDSIIEGNTLNYHWISRDPVSTYLVVLTGKNNYKLDIVNWINPNTNETVPFRFYYNNGENIAYIKSIIGDMCTYFSANFGDHPFEKNGFATLNNEFSWGGMENQTLTSLRPNGWSESLIVHEFAHQWFGDMITCATWADIWLNEGFATWSEAFWIENKTGHQDYINELISNADYYRFNNPGWAISNPNWAINTPNSNTLFNYAITYQKGSCVLHMLRYVLTDEVFFPALKSYAEDTVNFKYKSATINDFKDKMEAESNQELDWFFDSWIYTPNHPTYNNTYYFENAGKGNWLVNFIAKQQVGLTYWQMPIELRIEFSDNTDTLVRVFNSFNAQHFIFEFTKEPLLVEFDPNDNILLKDGQTLVKVETANEATSVLGLKALPAVFFQNTTIEFLSHSNEKIFVELFDAWGKRISTLFIGALPIGENKLPLDGTKLSPGLYFIVVRSGIQSETLKVIKIQ